MQIRVTKKSTGVQGGGKAIAAGTRKNPKTSGKMGAVKKNGGAC